jgi:hypothetical protein
MMAKKAQYLKLKSIDTKGLPDFVTLVFSSKSGATEYRHMVNAKDLCWWVGVLEKCDTEAKEK